MEASSSNHLLDCALQAGDIRLARRALIAGADPNLEMVWHADDPACPGAGVCFTPLEWSARMSVVGKPNAFRRLRWYALIDRLLAAGADATHLTKGLGDGARGDTVSLALLFRNQSLLALMSKHHVCLPADRMAFYLDKARAEAQLWPEGEAWIRRHVAIAQYKRLEATTPPAPRCHAIVVPRL